MSTTNHIEDYTLLTLIGQGSMGEVWRAVHRPSGQLVALKLLPLEEHPTSLHTEMEAISSLHHPHVIGVYDYGLVDRDDVPYAYLAMEWCSGGVIRPRQLVTWQTVGAMASTLLGALSHAHARGVIHRDLKPANILLAVSMDSRPGIKLSDFGIAHLQHRATAEERKAIGTPRYMAPEQFRGRLQDIGPWTDLYALGVLLWELVCGVPPFQSNSPSKLSMLHLYEDLPDFQPAMSVPSGLEGLLRQLLSKPSSHRPQFAADVQHALMSLGPATTPALGFTSFAIPRSAPDEVTLDGFLMGTTASLTLHLPTDREEAPKGHRPVKGYSMEVPARPFPPTWKEGLDLSAPVQASPTTPALFGFRAVPLVGREQVRQRLWKSLSKVKETATPGAVLLHGSAGVGKSALAQWFCQRAHETGAADFLYLSNSRNPSSQDGLAAAIARRLKLKGLPPDERRAQIRTLWPRGTPATDGQVSAVESLLDERETGHGPTGRERIQLLVLLLRNLSADRPFLVWVDDIQWSTETLSFTQHLLDAQYQLPVLLVLTAQDEALMETPAVQQSLNELVASTPIQMERIPPMNPADTRHLIRSLLGVAPELATDLAERTGGNPLFAVHLLSDWVHRGLLKASRNGYRLQKGVDVPLPRSLHDAWQDRLSRLFAPHPATMRHALELAAALGIRVNRSEWAAVCEAEGLSDPTAYVSVLFRERLARSTPDGWSFAHGMLREAIAEQSKANGTWSRRHEACAEMLRRRPSPSLVSLRRGRHLLEAGYPQRAIPPLLEATRQLLQRHAIREANSLLYSVKEALKSVGEKAKRHQWAVWWLMKARVLLISESLDEAFRLTRQAEQAAEEAEWGRLLPEALTLQADIARARADLPTAGDRYQAALRAYESIEDEEGAAQVLLSMSEVSLMRGAPEEAEALLTQAQSLLGLLEEHDLEPQLFMAAGDIARVRYRLDDAKVAYQKAYALYRVRGKQREMAQSLNGLAELERISGDIAAAELGYRKVLQLEEELGIDNTISRVNLILCLLDRHAFDEVPKQLAQAEAALQAQGRPGYVAAVHVMWLPLCAYTQDWTGWRHHSIRAHKLLNQSAIIDMDIAKLAEQAGDLAHLRGNPICADEAWRLSLRHWRALDMRDNARRVRSKLV